MSNLNLNKVVLCGRLTADPELKQTQNGIAEFALPIALNDPVGSYEITITDAATKTTEKIRIACKQ